MLRTGGARGDDSPPRTRRLVGARVRRPRPRRADPSPRPGRGGSRRGHAVVQAAPPRRRVDLGLYAPRPAGRWSRPSSSSSPTCSARTFGLLDDEQLARPVVYAYPSEQERTILWMGRQVVHEVEHHLRRRPARRRRLNGGPDQAGRPGAQWAGGRCRRGTGAGAARAVGRRCPEGGRARGRPGRPPAPTGAAPIGGLAAVAALAFLGECAADVGTQHGRTSSSPRGSSRSPDRHHRQK